MTSISVTMKISNAAAMSGTTVVPAVRFNHKEIAAPGRRLSRTKILVRRWRCSQGHCF